MEDLFWTTLNLNGKEEEYHIVFENERYCFIPKDSSHTTFYYLREHDEWHGADAASEEVKEEAVEELEKYLMRQH